MEKPIKSDCHVHCGQYYEQYYQPASIVKALYNNGIKNAWLSSTTSCIEWSNQEEKEYLIRHIDDEIEEAVLTANDLGLNLTPLYWVIPQRHIDGEIVEDVIRYSYYKGFKIHTKVGGWDKDTAFTRKLFNEVCFCAEKYHFPILIHTGMDIVDSPKRFEKYFSNYKNVKFVLAHCKNTDEIIDLFSKYNNVFGDTSFCPIESYNKICEYGFSERMQSGTDFPIPHWIKAIKKEAFPDEEELTLCYKKLYFAEDKNSVKRLRESGLTVESL